MCKLKTFDEWSSQGYRIIYGSKCVGRDSYNKPLFSKEQVEKISYYEKYPQDRLVKSQDEQKNFDAFLDDLDVSE